MTLIEHLHSLIETGKFHEQSSDAGYIYLYVLARSQGKPVKIQTEEVVLTTGLDEDAIQDSMKSLIDSDLIRKKSAKPLCVEPVESLDWDEVNLPLPQNRKKWILGFQESIENFVSGQWSGILAGSLMVYFIHFWFEHIHDLDQVDSDQACETLTRDSVFEGFQELEVLAYKHLEKPLHQIHPLEWVGVLKQRQEAEAAKTAKTKISMEEVDSMFEALDSSTEEEF